METWIILVGVLLNYVAATGIVFFIRYLYETGFTYGKFDWQTTSRQAMKRINFSCSDYFDDIPLRYDMAGDCCMCGFRILKDQEDRYQTDRVICCRIRDGSAFL